MLFNIESTDSSRENDSSDDNMFHVDRNANKSPLLFNRNPNHWRARPWQPEASHTFRHNPNSPSFLRNDDNLWDDIPREDHFVLFFNDKNVFLSVELMPKPGKYWWIRSADWTTAGWGKSKEETTQMVDRKNDRFSIGADENESFSFVSTSFYKQ